MPAAYIPPEWERVKRNMIVRSIVTGLLIMAALVWGTRG